MFDMYKQIINILDIRNRVRRVLQHLHLNDNIFVDWLICGQKMGPESYKNPKYIKMCST